MLGTCWELALLREALQSNGPKLLTSRHVVVRPPGSGRENKEPKGMSALVDSNPASTHRNLCQWVSSLGQHVG